MKKIRFALTVTAREIRGIFRVIGRIPAKDVLMAIKHFLKGFIHIENMPREVQGQVAKICNREAYNFDYMFFKWKSLGRLEMLYCADEFTGYDYFVAENEVD